MNTPSTQPGPSERVKSAASEPHPRGDERIRLMKFVTLFGFGGIAAGAVEIAKVLFFIFLVLFIVSLVLGLFRRDT